MLGIVNGTGVNSMPSGLFLESRQTCSYTREPDNGSNRNGSGD